MPVHFNAIHVYFSPIEEALLVSRQRSPSLCIMLLECAGVGREKENTFAQISPCLAVPTMSGHGSGSKNGVTNELHNLETISVELVK